MRPFTPAAALSSRTDLPPRSLASAGRLWHGPPPMGAHADRILLIDDEEDSREAYAEFLRMNEFAVDEYSTAADALAAAAETMPAAVIVDISLKSGIDGYEAARRLRAMPGGARVRLIAMTGYSPAVVKQQGELFDAILTKPAGPDELVALVQRLTRG